MVLPRFVAQALQGEHLTVYGDGTQSRCFTHVYDTVDGIIAVADSPDAVGGAFNIGTSHSITINELADLVIDRLGSQSKVKYVPYREAYGEGFEELGSRKPDTRLIEELCGWRPHRTIVDAIDDLAMQLGGVEAPKRQPSRRGLLTGLEQAAELST
jgi:UDP-glucose 4-epimerase